MAFASKPPASKVSASASLEFFQYKTIESEKFNKTIETLRGRTLSGIEFNHLIGSEPMIKFTTDTENHNGYQFKTGLNTDTRPFYNKGSCTQGGIYFSSLYNFHLWAQYGNKHCVQFRYVTVPDDAQVYIEAKKFKVNKMILSEPQKFNTLSQLWEEDKYSNVQAEPHCFMNIPYIMNEKFDMPESYYMKYINQQPKYVTHTPAKFLKNKEFRMKLYDINASIFSKLIRYRDTTECLDVLIKNLQNFKDFTPREKQTPELYTVALAADPMMIAYVSSYTQTPDICNYAFSHNPATFQYLTHKTPAMYLPAISAVPANLKLIPFGEQTDELIMTAVESDGTLIQYADYQTYPIARAAVKQNGEAFAFVENQRPLTIIREADGTVTQEYDDSLIETAIETYPRAVLHLKSFNEKTFIKAIEKDHMIITKMNTSIAKRWVTKPMKEILFRRDMKTGIKYYPDFPISEEIMRDALDIDRENVTYISSTRKYTQDFAEYIYNEFPNIRNRVIDSMSRSYHEALIKEDPLAALFSDTTLEVAEEMLG